jgi:hypothetical protein
MGTRICEFCFNYYATSSDLIAHYQADHKEEDI